MSILYREYINVYPIMFCFPLTLVCLAFLIPWLLTSFKITRCYASFVILYIFTMKLSFNPVPFPGSRHCSQSKPDHVHTYITIAPLITPILTVTRIHLSSNSITSFRRNLKTYLFNQAFTSWLATYSKRPVTEFLPRFLSLQCWRKFNLT